MTRPEPRRSALAGLTPASPTPPTPSTPSTTSRPSVPSLPSGTTKITVALPADLVGRARNAYWSTGHLTGTRSFAAWVAQALEAKLSSDEATFNDGRAWPPLPPGEIPTGRRI